MNLRLYRCSNFFFKNKCCFWICAFIVKVQFNNSNMIWYISFQLQDFYLLEKTFRLYNNMQLDFLMKKQIWKRCQQSTCEKSQKKNRFGKQQFNLFCGWFECDFLFIFVIVSSLNFVFTFAFKHFVFPFFVLMNTIFFLVWRWRVPFYNIWLCSPFCRWTFFHTFFCFHFC